MGSLVNNPNRDRTKAASYYRLHPQLVVAAVFVMGRNPEPGSVKQCNHRQRKQRASPWINVQKPAIDDLNIPWVAVIDVDAAMTTRRLVGEHIRRPFMDDGLVHQQRETAIR